MTPAQFRKIRLFAKLSHEELATLIGVSVWTIYSYENGNRKVPKPVTKLMELLANRKLQP